MDIQIGTTPICCLPYKLSLGKEKQLLLLSKEVETIIYLKDLSTWKELEIEDMKFDLIYCINKNENVMFIGSEYGGKIYILDLKEIKILQVINIDRDEEEIWNRLFFLIPPDQHCAVVLSDMALLVLSWRGEILAQYSLYVNDSFEAIHNQAVVLYGTPEEKIFELPLTGF